MLRGVFLPIKVDNQPSVKVTVIPDKTLYILHPISITLKDIYIGRKLHQRSFTLGCFFGICNTRKVSRAKLSHTYFIFPNRLNLEVRRKRIYRLGSYTVQSYRFLKRFRIILSTGIHLRHYIYDFSQRNSPTVITNYYFIIFDVHFDSSPCTHHELIYAVVHHLFEKHIYAIIRRRTVTEFPDIHSWSHADVLFPIEGAYIIFGIFYFF